jgi:hypothetical protein
MPVSSSQSGLAVVQVDDPGFFRPGSATPATSGRYAPRSGCGMPLARKRPVREAAFCLMPAGVSLARMVPPWMPAPGPRSMMRSARSMTTSSCSTTSTVLPLARSEPGASRSAGRCRGRAGRWRVRRARRARRKGSSRAGPRGGCAGPRRRRASRWGGRARGSRGRPGRGISGAPRFADDVLGDELAAGLEVEVAERGEQVVGGEVGQLRQGD